MALRLSEPQSQRTVFPGLVALGDSPMSGGLDRKSLRKLQLLLLILIGPGQSASAQEFRKYSIEILIITLNLIVPDNLMYAE